MRIGSVTLALALLASVAAAGCAGPSARIKDSDEGDLVDTRKGGTETYKALVNKATTQLLEEHRLVLGGSAEKPMVAFVGIENRSSEELGEFRKAMTNEIETAMVASRLYAMLSGRAIEAAKREANVRDAADLTVARPRQAFLAVLNKDGAPPQYFLFGEVTSMSSSGNSARERTYQLTLQMMDASTGVIQTQKMVELRKEYTE
jgi:hypothetical protein